MANGVTTIVAMLAKGAESSCDESFEGKQVVLSSVMPCYHQKVPQHEMPTVDRKHSGPICTSVRIFLHEFETQGKLAYGSTTFAAICYHLLALANLDQKVKDKMDIVCTKDLGPKWTWKTCKTVFVDCVLTLHEHQTEVEEFAYQGQEKTESYEEYAASLCHLVETYHVHDLVKQDDVVTSLKMLILSLAMTIMMIGQTQKLNMVKIGMEVLNVNCINFVMDAIPNILGPDECTKWRTSP